MSLRRNCIFNLEWDIGRCFFIFIFFRIFEVPHLHSHIAFILFIVCIFFKMLFYIWKFQVDIIYFVLSKNRNDFLWIYVPHFPINYEKCLCWRLYWYRRLHYLKVVAQRHHMWIIKIQNKWLSNLFVAYIRVNYNVATESYLDQSISFSAFYFIIFCQWRIYFMFNF